MSEESAKARPSATGAAIVAEHPVVVGMLSASETPIAVVMRVSVSHRNPIRFRYNGNKIYRNTLDFKSVVLISFAWEPGDLLKGRHSLVRVIDRVLAH